MPREFEMCVKQGGKVRTKKISKTKYVHICYVQGKSYLGEIKEKQYAKTTA